MKEPSGLLGQTYITSRDIREAVIQTAEIVSMREATDIFVKTLNGTYVKS